MITLKFRSKLWMYQAPGGWHFVTLPKTRAKEIKRLLPGTRRGFGSLRVRATIGKTSWRTSIFPDSKSDSYLLPVKADVRTKERIEDGDAVTVVLDVMI